MTPYETYIIFSALKRHFSSVSYDFIKYHGKIKSSYKSFDKCKDRYSYDKLSKHSNPKNLFLANLLENKNIWIGNVNNSVYDKWLQKQQSLTYHFTNDLSNLDDNFNDNFIFQQSCSNPQILSLYFGKRITLETLTILVNMVKCLPYWEKMSVSNPLINDTCLLVKKYIPFLQYEHDKLSGIIIDRFPVQ
jgi:hypothetical protein